MRSWTSYQVTVSSKWVLTGEHSVLRGAMAVALPSDAFQLTLEFKPYELGSAQPFAVQSELLEENLMLSNATLGSEFVLDVIQELANLRQVTDGTSLAPPGELRIRSTIPIGAGLGSSAALCVAIVNWLSGPLQISTEAVMGLATQLEHRFHGKSSGMDVAVIAAHAPITFTMQTGLQKLAVDRLPRFTLHDTGLRSRTSDCILQVEAFRKAQPQLATQVDQRMAEASLKAEEGLLQFSAGDSERGLAGLERAMSEAQRCFQDWDLVPESVRLLQQRLKQDGARATKLTGAGGGGMVVALW